MSTKRKEVYERPALVVVELNPENIICGSEEQKSGNVGMQNYVEETTQQW